MSYKKLQAALGQNQAAVDNLTDEEKKAALVEAEESLTPMDGSRDVFQGGTEFENEITQFETEDGKPKPEPKLEDRELYGGIRMPRNMNETQTKAYKAGIDERLLGAEERLQKRIESAGPMDQVKDLMRRASEGDAEALKDIGYFGLNVAAMSPIGQPGQMVADAGVAGADAMKGDYTGAAISGAAVILPVTAAMLKSSIKNIDAATLLKKIPDNQHADAGMYVDDLMSSDAATGIKKLSDKELAGAYKSIMNANIAIRRGPRTPDVLVSPEKMKEIESKFGGDYQAIKKALDEEAFLAVDDAFARNHAAKQVLMTEMQARAGGDAAAASNFSKMISKARGSTEMQDLQKAYESSLAKMKSAFKDATVKQ